MASDKIRVLEEDTYGCDVLCHIKPQALNGDPDSAMVWNGAACTGYVTISPRADNFGFFEDDIFRYIEMVKCCEYLWFDKTQWL